jgi:hypothetical protein
VTGVLVAGWAISALVAGWSAWMFIDWLAHGCPNRFDP